MTTIGKPRGRVMSARARLERMMFTSISIGAVVYTGILFTGSGGIKAETPQLTPWYGLGLIVVSLVLPVSLGFLAWLAPRRVTRALAIATSLLFLIAIIIFPLGLPAATLLDNENPWYQGIHAFHGLILATATQRRWIWLYAGVQGTCIGIIQVIVREDAVKSATLSGINSIVYMTIIMTTGVAVVRAAERLDAAAHAGRERAAANAVRRTQDREEARIDAMVHDDIMSVLLTASRPQPPASLGEQARAALSSIDLLDDAGLVSRDYSTDEAVRALFDAVERIAPAATTSRTGEFELAVPAVVVTALHDAMAEALRNALRHAGTAELGAAPIHVSVQADAHGLRVVVRDEGKGFAMRSVASRRLGLKLSIVERMSLVDGGRAEIHSKPGSGTTVTLSWSGGTE